MKEIISRVQYWLTQHSFVRTCLVILLALLCFLEIETIVSGIIELPRTNESVLIYGNGHSIRESDIQVPDDIQSWMTFEYINFVFKLPPNYLSEILAINNPRYPNIGIARYAHLNNLPTDAFLIKVRQTVTTYLQGTF